MALQGNHGGGRKSSYQELSEALELDRMWRDPNAREKLEKKFASGKPMSLKEMYMLKALKGDGLLLAKILDKKFPATVKSEGNMGNVNINVRVFGDEDSLAKDIAKEKLQDVSS